jgi:hypothetical protein
MADDIALKILMMIIGTAISVGIGMMLWKIRKANGKDEDREKRREEREIAMREDFIKMQTEFERMKEDWKEKKVDKAYDSSLMASPFLENYSSRLFLNFSKSFLRSSILS